VGGDLADLNHGDGRLPQECDFGRIEIPGAQEEGGLRLDRSEPGTVATSRSQQSPVAMARPMPSRKPVVVVSGVL
jgi:hypothetical protein